MKQFKDNSIPTQVPSHEFKAEKQISTSKTAKINQAVAES